MNIPDSKSCINPDTDGFPVQQTARVQPKIVSLGIDDSFSHPAKTSERDQELATPANVEPNAEPFPKDGRAPATRTCPQGHPVHDPTARFCTSCGQSLSDGVHQRASNSLEPKLLKTSGSGAIHQPKDCSVCESGSKLSHQRPYCAACRRLHPISPGYRVEPALFQWAQDGQAMAKLRSMPTLNAVARKVSDQVGRRWIESTFNGVRLSERQMPQLFLPAILAARRLGLTSLPDIYVSGERPWDALTFGSDHNGFLVMGSALVSSFKGAELGFLFAREFGHILAGHALWQTVIRFLVGEHNPKAGLIRNGIVGLLDPGKWIEGAIEVPLLNWARQAEITADRAGLLALGNQHIVRRVLLSWSLKSPFLYRHVNVDAWLEQQQEDAMDEGIRIAELMTSSTPYISRRLKLLTDYDRGDEMAFARQHLPHLRETRSTARVAQETKPPSNLEPSAAAGSFGGFQCPNCRSLIQVPAEVAESAVSKIRCPNENCGRVHTIRRRTRTESRRQADRTNLQSVD